MIVKYDELTLDEINNWDFLDREELKKLSFAELCIYQESLNKIKARYDELVKGE